MDDGDSAEQPNPLGYRQVEGADGPELVYSPAEDQRLGSSQSRYNPVEADYREYLRRNMRAAVYNFLINDLNDIQREQLREEVAEMLFGQPDSAEAVAARAMSEHEPSPQGFSQLYKLAMALYHYRRYVYNPLVAYAGGEIGPGIEGLLVPSILAMGEETVNSFPSLRPFTDIAMGLPIAAQLFYYNRYKLDNLGKALATATYALTLSLLARASTGLLANTSFQLYPAGLLTSAYEGWRRGDWWHTAIELSLALQSARNRRAVMFAMLGGLLVGSLNIPNTDVAARRAWERPLDANYMMPVLLSVCCTDDWGSSLATALILAFNQMAYSKQSMFLHRGEVTEDNPPHWVGTVGTTLALGLTLAVYWQRIPSLAQTGESCSAVLSEMAEWLNYLFMSKGVLRPDWNRSGFIHRLTAALGLFSPQHAGEQFVVDGEQAVKPVPPTAEQGRPPASLLRRAAGWIGARFGYGGGAGESDTHEVVDQDLPGEPALVDG